MKTYTYLVLTFDGTTQEPQGVVTVHAENYRNAIHKARFVAFLHLKVNPATIITDLLSQVNENAQ